MINLNDERRNTIDERVLKPFQDTPANRLMYFNCYSSLCFQWLAPRYNGPDNVITDELPRSISDVLNVDAL